MLFFDVEVTQNDEINPIFVCKMLPKLQKLFNTSRSLKVKGRPTRHMAPYEGR
jgi:hypothetical protein